MNAYRDLAGSEQKLREVRKVLNRRAEAIDAIRTAAGYMKGAESRNVRRVADASADFLWAQDDVEIEAIASDADALQRVVDEVGVNAWMELTRAHNASAAREKRISKAREDLSRRARSDAVDQAQLRPEAEKLRDALTKSKIAAISLCELIDIREGKELARSPKTRGNTKPGRRSGSSGSRTRSVCARRSAFAFDILLPDGMPAGFSIGT